MPQLAIRDMALASGKNTDDGLGISGYQIPLWQHAIEKPNMIKISNSKTKSYINQLMKEKALIPSPS